MNKDTFTSLFEIPELTPLYCGYQGGMHLTIADEPGESRFARILLGLMRKVQAVANVVMVRMFQDNVPESAALSPFLLYIGRKK